MLAIHMDPSGTLISANFHTVQLSSNTTSGSQDIVATQQRSDMSLYNVVSRYQVSDRQ
jgi:hypothetical protein